MFRLFVDLNQCRHIYFAGCHDTGFTSLLTPYRGSDRITLIKAASFHREFEDLNLPIRELPSVFMSTPLAVTKPAAPVQTINTKITNTMTGTKPICKHFQKVTHSLLYPIFTKACSCIIRESANLASVATSNMCRQINNWLDRQTLTRHLLSNCGLLPQSWVARRNFLPPRCQRRV
jgi:hypothetical protein